MWGEIEEKNMSKTPPCLNDRCPHNKKGLHKTWGNCNRTGDYMFSRRSCPKLETEASQRSVFKPKDPEKYNWGCVPGRLCNFLDSTKGCNCCLLHDNWRLMADKHKAMCNLVPCYSPKKKPVVRRFTWSCTEEEWTQLKENFPHRDSISPFVAGMAIAQGEVCSADSVPCTITEEIKKDA